MQAPTSLISALWIPDYTQLDREYSTYILPSKSVDIWASSLQLSQFSHEAYDDSSIYCYPLNWDKRQQIYIISRVCHLHRPQVCFPDMFVNIQSWCDLPGHPPLQLQMIQPEEVIRHIQVDMIMKPITSYHVTPLIPTLSAARWLQGPGSYICATSALHQLSQQLRFVSATRWPYDPTLGQTNHGSQILLNAASPSQAVQWRPLKTLVQNNAVAKDFTLNQPSLRHLTISTGAVPDNNHDSIRTSSANTETATLLSTTDAWRRQEFLDEMFSHLPTSDALSVGGLYSA